MHVATINHMKKYISFFSDNPYAEKSVFTYRGANSLKFCPRSRVGQTFMVPLWPLYTGHHGDSLEVTFLGTMFWAVPGFLPPLMKAYLVNRQVGLSTESYSGYWANLYFCRNTVKWGIKIICYQFWSSIFHFFQYNTLVLGHPTQDSAPPDIVLESCDLLLCSVFSFRFRSATFECRGFYHVRLPLRCLYFQTSVWTPLFAHSFSVPLHW